MSEKLRDLPEDSRNPRRRSSAHPEKVALYGGISGAELSLEEFEIAEGLSLRKTYAHVMAPYMMAFKPPPKEGGHHPAPWRAARGGIGFDISIQVKLQKDARPTEFNRLNTLWWVLALTRLKTGASIRMPVISDMEYHEIAEVDIEPILWPIEMSPHEQRTCAEPPRLLTEENLIWIKENFRSGARLAVRAPFSRAIQALDSARWMHSRGASIITIWAALEALFQPGSRQITKRLSRTIAAFLEDEENKISETYHLVRDLYRARGGAAHAAKAPEAKELLLSFDIARRAFIKCIEQSQLPDREKLLEKWRDHNASRA